MASSSLRRTLPLVQVVVLGIGVVFSWTALVLDYRRFFASGGHVLEISGCAVANPVMTPCFYGALAFLAAFLWAVVIWRSAPDAAARRQRNLEWLLIGGTAFAWGNFAWLVYLFLQPRPAASAFSCPPGEVVVYPLTAPCFYGALIFLAALVVSVLLRRA